MTKNKSNYPMLSVFLVLIVGLLTGCGPQKVPPAHKGKVLGTSGYNKQLLSEGTHFMWGWDNIVLIDLSTYTETRPLSVTMSDVDPDGKARLGLEMDFELSYRYRISSDTTTINGMFTALKIEKEVGLQAKRVFDVYGKAMLITTFRDVINQYKPNDVMTNRGVVNKAVSDAILLQFKGSPILITNIVVTKMTLPKLITDRLALIKDRELKTLETAAIQANALIVEENAIILARKRTSKDLILAKSAVAVNKVRISGLSPLVLRDKELDIKMLQAEAIKARMENTTSAGDVIFLPFETLGTQAANQRMLQH